MELVQIKKDDYIKNYDKIPEHFKFIEKLEFLENLLEYFIRKKIKMKQIVYKIIIKCIRIGLIVSIYLSIYHKSLFLVWITNFHFNTFFA